MNSKEIPDDILLEEIWKYLPAATLLKYCSLNRILNSICNRNSTWKYLISVDFNINYVGDDTKDEYKRLYNFKEITFEFPIDDPFFRNVFAFNQRLYHHRNHTIAFLFNDFLGTSINLDFHSEWMYYQAEKFRLVRELIDYFRIRFSIPKSYWHECSDHELFVIPLNILVGNSATRQF